MMMSSKQTQSLETPATHCKLPQPERTVGNVVPVNLHYPGGMHKYSPGEPVSYRGALISYCLNGLPPPCRSSDACLQNGRGPVIRSTSMERLSAKSILYGPGKSGFSAEDCSLLAGQETAAIQNLGNPDEGVGRGGAGRPGVHAPVPVRNMGISSPGVSPQTKSPAILAIPKPVYGVRPYHLGSGSCYSTDLGQQRTHLSTCEKEWMLHYRPVSLPQRAELNTLRQSSQQQQEAGGKCALKKPSLEGYHSPRLPRPPVLPNFAEPNCHGVLRGSPAHPILCPSAKQYLNSLNPHKMHPGPTPCLSYRHEDVRQAALSHTGIHPRMHQDCLAVAQGMPPPQRPMFPHPQGKEGEESVDAHKDVAGKSTPPANSWGSNNPLGRYTVEQACFSEAEIPHTVAPEGYPFHSNYDLSPYHVYKVEHCMGKKRTFSEGPGSPLLVQHTAHPTLGPQDPLLRAVCGCPHSPGAFRPVKPCFTRKCCLFFGTEDKLVGTDPYVRQRIAKHVSALRAKVFAIQKHNTPSQVKTQDSAHLCESPIKQPGERGQSQVPAERQESASPPMPVINSVFSLAPYKAYLQMSGVQPLQNMFQSGELNLQPDRQSHEKDTKPNPHEITSGSRPAVRSGPSHRKDSLTAEEPPRVKSEETASSVTSRSVELGGNETEGHHQGVGETGVHHEGDVVSRASEDALDLSMRKRDFSQSARETQLTAPPSSSSQGGPGGPIRQGEVSVPVQICLNKQTVFTPAPPAHPGTPQIVAVKQFPPKELQVCAIRLHLWPGPDSSQTNIPRPTETMANQDTLKQARHHFMESHQLLCSLISRSVSCTPEQELRAWLSKWEQRDSASPSAKTQCAREAWLRSVDTATALGRVVNQLEHCISTQEWPFPHVLRAGAVFIPILLVKETLFPQVPGALIDRVLQDHRVELRPATLSEERQLVHLQKRACSSKLRKLLSLKHLPDIYPDVLNLFYHTCVSRRLGEPT